MCGEKLRSHLRSSGRGGITPACAGKSSSSFWCSGVSIGSPPRVRGKAGLVGGHADYERITPACAGKRQAWPSRSPTFRDHPRVCGEKRNEQRPKHKPRGSPPRVRGKEVAQAAGLAEVGITPACAGKRLKSPLCCHREKGSPPRVRGKGGLDAADLLEAGITPACAGKSALRQPSPRLSKDHPRVCGEKTKESLKK